MEKYGYRFSFGPWNIHEGADPFGPVVRPSLTFAQKLPLYKELGFDAVQFHDDDAVPNLDELTPAQIGRTASQMRHMLEDHGLVAEFVAPRLWESPRTIDGGFTSNSPAERKYALDRSKIAADIARELGCTLMVLWLAREGTYMRESKDVGNRRIICLTPSTDCWPMTRICASRSSRNQTSRWTSPTSLRWVMRLP